MATYGYNPPRFGQAAASYTGRSPGLASALSGSSPLSGGYPQAPTRAPLSQQPAVAPRHPQGGQAQTVARPAPQPPPPVVATPTPYDINTDPILAQIQSFLGQSDEEANAGALAQKKQTLLGYGDPNLASELLGPGESDFASAVGANPGSTLAGLHHQHDQNTATLTELLNKNNLFYSGNRILQEQQAAQDYQNALGQAAGAVQGGLGTIGSNLAAALRQNQSQRLTALGDAFGRHQNDPGYGTVPDGTHGQQDQPQGPLPEGATAGWAPPPDQINAGLGGISGISPPPSTQGQLTIPTPHVAGGTSSSYGFDDPGMLAMLLTLARQQGGKGGIL